MKAKVHRMTDAVSRRLSSRGRPSGGTKSTAKPSPYSYKQLMSEKSFLKVASRAARVQGFSLLSVDYLADSTGIELRYLVNSVERPGVKYNVVLRIDSLSPDSLVSRPTSQVATLLRMSGIKVYCSCPAFLYWGYQYKAEHRNYAAFKLGVRYPKIRNPHLQGFICKHTYACLSVTSAMWGKYAKMLKDHISESRAAEVQDSLQRALKQIKL